MDKTSRLILVLGVVALMVAAISVGVSIKKQKKLEKELFEIKFSNEVYQMELNNYVVKFKAQKDSADYYKSKYINDEKKLQEIYHLAITGSDESVIEFFANEQRQFNALDTVP